MRIVAGDASIEKNSYYRVNAEGVLTIDHTPTSSSRGADRSVIVTVSDGQLTISNAAGAKNNKVCFLDITPH